MMRLAVLMNLMLAVFAGSQCCYDGDSCSDCDDQRDFCSISKDHCDSCGGTLCGTPSPAPTADRGFRAKILHFVKSPFDYGVDDNDASDFMEDGLLVVGSDGKVQACGDYKETIGQFEGLAVTDYRPHLLMPGFIDTHVHAPQYTMIASYGEWLLPWLQDYTFPAESKFKEGRAYSQPLMSRFLKDLIRMGTTTAAIWPTAFADTTDVLFDEAAKLNMRIITGKIGMDRCQFGVFDTAKFGYCDTAESFYNESKGLIHKWHGKGRALYAVTPRFAPSSTEDQLTKAGELLAEFPTVYMQTHLSENFDEVALVLDMYKHISTSYLGVYDHFGLVGPRSIFGHVIHLSPADWELLSEKGSAAAMCPTSNFFLGSGLFNLRQANASSVPVGLGSDVGAGTSLCPFRTMAEAYKDVRLSETWQSSMQPEGTFPRGGVVRISNQDVADPAAAAAGAGPTAMPAPENMVVPNSMDVSAARAFYLHTLGAAKSLKLDDILGNFEVGKEADFVVVNFDGSWPTQYRMAHVRQDTDKMSQLWERLFALMIMGDDRNVFATHIMGEQVYQNPHTNPDVDGFKYPVPTPSEWMA